LRDAYGNACEARARELRVRELRVRARVRDA